MTETLREMETRFAFWLPRLIDKAFAMGYLVTGGEWKRDARVAQLNAQTGAGVAASVHIHSLAVDLNLFHLDGTYITDDTGHRDLGAWWKAQQPGFCWGGDFHTADFDHYSLSPDGIHK